MTEEVKRLIEKAEHAIEVAEKLIESGYPSDAAKSIIPCFMPLRHC